MAAAISPAAITAATKVGTQLDTAHTAMLDATKIADTAPSTKLAPLVDSAIEGVNAAREGVRNLSQPIIDAAAYRWTTHSLRDLDAAARKVSLLDSTSDHFRTPEYRQTLVEQLVDTGRSIRLAHDAVVRSLESPRLRAEVRSSSGGDASSSPSGGGYSDYGTDGLDALGNPTRGSDVWAGPDGQTFDSMGNPASSGGGSSFDGGDYNGI